ncbi:YdcF family protein [Collimonas antrihumi]|uniref:YdcF family protein n=1 Tax=Collimonas antrihumi TaxID=1940615 RepID=UPI001B8CF157|nr:YdcF family protein [Collimonas antrihumi]
MHATFIITKVVSALLLLPANLILLCIAGMLLRRAYPSTGMVVSLTSLLLLAVLSTKAGALLLVAPLEQRVLPLAVDVAGATNGAQAIVILGMGKLANAPEYDGEDVASYLTLARLRYGAKMHRQTGLPILVSGGMPDGSKMSEAAVMARSLREDFSTPVKWIEGASDDTEQNAKFSAAILAQAGVKKIILVTDALHMPRSQMMFARTGLEVVIAPTVFFSRDRLTLLSFLPSGEGMRRSGYALHEWLGVFWYKARHGDSQQAGTVSVTR